MNRIRTVVLLALLFLMVFTAVVAFAQRSLSRIEIVTCVTAAECNIHHPNPQNGDIEVGLAYGSEEVIIRGIGFDGVLEADGINGTIYVLSSEEWAFSAIYPSNDALRLALDKRTTAVFAGHNDVRIIGARSTEDTARYIICDIARRVADGAMVFALKWPVKVHLFSDRLKQIGSVEIVRADCAL